MELPKNAHRRIPGLIGDMLTPLNGSESTLESFGEFFTMYSGMDHRHAPPILTDDARNGHVSNTLRSASRTQVWISTSCCALKNVHVSWRTRTVC